MKMLTLWPLALASLLPAGELEVVVAPRATVVEHDGITGGGYPLFIGERSFVIYPNHLDDFGGSAGTGSAQTKDGGITWARGTDGWPMPEMIDLWIDQLDSGELLAMGIRWVPDPQKRRDVTAQVAPTDAWKITISNDRGRNWELLCVPCLTSSTTVAGSCSCPRMPGAGAEIARFCCKVRIKDATGPFAPSLRQPSQ